MNHSVVIAALATSTWARKAKLRPLVTIPSSPEKFPDLNICFFYVRIFETFPVFLDGLYVTCSFLSVIRSLFRWNFDKKVLIIIGFTLIGIHAIMQSASHMMQTIQTFKTSASVKLHVRHEDEEKCDLAEFEYFRICRSAEFHTERCGKTKRNIDSERWFCGWKQLVDERRMDRRVWAGSRNSKTTLYKRSEQKSIYKRMECGAGWAAADDHAGLQACHGSEATVWKLENWKKNLNNVTGKWLFLVCL